MEMETFSGAPTVGIHQFVPWKKKLQWSLYDKFCTFFIAFPYKVQLTNKLQLIAFLQRLNVCGKFIGIAKTDETSHFIFFPGLFRFKWE